MSKVDIVNKILELETLLVHLLVSKHLLFKDYIIIPNVEDFQAKIVDLIAEINAYYVLLKSK